MHAHQNCWLNFQISSQISKSSKDICCFTFRWDASSVDQLPDYMKPCYQALLEVYEEMEEEIAKEGNLYRVQYAKAAVCLQ